MKLVFREKMDYLKKKSRMLHYPFFAWIKGFAPKFNRISQRSGSLRLTASCNGVVPEQFSALT